MLNFIPLIAFFTFYKLYNIFVASGAIIIANAFILLLYWIIYKRLEKIHIFTFVLVVIFSTLTIIFHNDQFIKIKLIIINLLIAFVMLYSQLFMKQNIIEKILGDNLKLPKKIWCNLNISCTIFFFGCSIASTYFAFCCSQETWVIFKVFGLTTVSLLFSLLNWIYISLHI